MIGYIITLFLFIFFITFSLGVLLGSAMWTPPIEENK